MRHCTCAPDASWCARTDELFGVEDMHVLDVTRDPDVGGEQGLVVLDVESDADLTGCPDCGWSRSPRPARPGPVRRPVLRHTGAGAVAQADLALPRTLVSSRDLDRGARLRAAAGQAHQPGGGVGRQSAAARRHHSVGDRAAARVNWHTCSERGQEARRDLDRHQQARVGGEGHRGRRAHLAPEQNLLRGQGRHGEGRPHPRLRPASLSAATQCRAGQVRHGVRRLAQGARGRGHRVDRIRRAGPVPQVSQRDP